MQYSAFLNVKICTVAARPDSRSLRWHPARFALNRADIVKTKSLPANPLGAALHFLDYYPGGIPQPFADERNTASVMSWIISSVWAADNAFSNTDRYFTAAG